MLYFREIYHGSVWNTDSRFLAPRVKLSDGKSIALRDCVYLAELGTVVGVVVMYFHARTPCAGRAIYQPGTPRKVCTHDTCTYITCTHLPRHQSAHAICQSCRLFLLEDMQLPSTSCCSADQVIEHNAIMSQHKCSVNSEDYIELVTP